MSFLSPWFGKPKPKPTNEPSAYLDPSRFHFYKVSFNPYVGNSKTLYQSEIFNEGLIAGIELMNKRIREQEEK